MTIWFTADTHFGEQPRTRHKASGLPADALDVLIEQRWRERVADGDTVWHLGDVGKDWQRLADLPGTKHLILGNCDAAPKKMAASPIFASLGQSHRLALPDGGSLYLIHIPEQALDRPANDVVHGHHHHRTPRPGHRSVSVDRIDWGRVSLEELLLRES